MTLTTSMPGEPLFFRSGGTNRSPARELWHRLATYNTRVRTPIRNPPDPMYGEFEVHRTMIRDRVRTEAFRRARSTRWCVLATSFSTSKREAAS